jgi:hypothetical protein
VAKIADEDLVAVRVYLTKFYKEIDTALRRADRVKLQEFDPHIRLATNALFQLPAFRGVVYRGTTLPDDVTPKYTPGIVIRERAFVSASADPARRFPGNVQYIIVSVTGRKVRALGDDPEEQEILFFTATRFKVLAVDLDPATGVRTVYLCEIPDPRLIQAPGPA